MTPRALLLLLLLLAAPAGEALIYLPDAAAPAEIAATLRAAPALAAWQVRAVAKHRAFVTALTPAVDAVLCPAAALPAGWQPTRVLGRGGVRHERLALVAIDPAVDRARLAAGTVGLLLDGPREGLEATWAALMPGIGVGHLRPAARAEDVPRLLGLEMAQACLLTPAMRAEAERVFPGAVRELAQSRARWRPLLALRAQAPADATAFLDLPPAALAALGGDAFLPLPDPPPADWRAPLDAEP